MSTPTGCSSMSGDPSHASGWGSNYSGTVQDIILDRKKKCGGIDLGEFVHFSRVGSANLEASDMSYDPDSRVGTLLSNAQMVLYHDAYCVCYSPSHCLCVSYDGA